MLQPSSDDRHAVYDQADRFGWISIALHWLTAAAVLVLWFAGKGIAFADVDKVESQRNLHMSMGIVLWLLLAGRIVWRLQSGHPRARGLTDFTHRVAKYSHYALLVAVSLMLLSGPLMAWANGAPIPVFGWFAVPGPLDESPALRNAMHTVHVASSNIILWLTLLHIAGALKHLMFHDDDAFVRMLWPRR